MEIAKYGRMLRGTMSVKTVDEDRRERLRQLEARIQDNRRVIFFARAREGIMIFHTFSKLQQKSLFNKLLIPGYSN